MRASGRVTEGIGPPVLTLEAWLVGSMRDRLPVELVLLESTLFCLFNQGRDLTRITCDTRALEESGGSRPSAKNLFKLDHLTLIGLVRKKSKSHVQTDRFLCEEASRSAHFLVTRSSDSSLLSGGEADLLVCPTLVLVHPHVESDQFRNFRINFSRREWHTQDLGPRIPGNSGLILMVWEWTHSRF